MSEEIKDGGPAFFVGCEEHGNGHCPCRGLRGLTVRQWFAGMALQGLLARGYDTLDQFVAEGAYRIADAMLRHTEKTNG